MWLDGGASNSPQEAGESVAAIEGRQESKDAVPLRMPAKRIVKARYGGYLLDLLGCEE